MSDKEELAKDSAENLEIETLAPAEVETQAEKENLEVEVAVVEAPVPAPVKAPAKEKYAAPIAVTLEDIEDAKPKVAGPAVVSNNAVDDVVLAKIVYKNLYARKSLSVHHLQRRLVELGYVEAGQEKDGYYGDATKRAVAKFQIANKLEVNGFVDAKVLNLVFAGDPNVRVVI